MTVSVPRVRNPLKIHGSQVTVRHERLLRDEIPYTRTKTRQAQGVTTRNVRHSGTKEIKGHFHGSSLPAGTLVQEGGTPGHG